MIECAVPARVGILANPSDGFGGRTLALAVPQFSATVRLEPAERVEIVPGADDQPAWPSVAAMADHVDRYGYGTGAQLLAAAVRTFAAVASAVGCPLRGGFRLSYTTSIPRQVGLGGSSALVIGALRCLNQHFGLDMPPEVLPSVALQAETAELALAAGLQDRVPQVLGGLVAMDFTEPHVDARFGVSHGTYERLDPAALPPLFVAWQEAGLRPPDSHQPRLRSRLDGGDPLVRETLRELAALVVEGRAALRWGDQGRLATLIDRNLQLRRLLGPLPEWEEELVEVAQATGSPCTVAGAGGAVVGVLTGDDTHFEQLCDAYADVGADAVRVEIPPAPSHGAGAGLVGDANAGNGGAAHRAGEAGADTHPDDHDGADADSDDGAPGATVLSLDRHDHHGSSGPHGPGRARPRGR